MDRVARALQHRLAGHPGGGARPVPDGHRRRRAVVACLEALPGRQRAGADALPQRAREVQHEPRHVPRQAGGRAAHVQRPLPRGPRVHLRAGRLRLAEPRPHRGRPQPGARAVLLGAHREAEREQRALRHEGCGDLPHERGQARGRRLHVRGQRGLRGHQRQVRREVPLQAGLRLPRQPRVGAVLVAHRAHHPGLRVRLAAGLRSFVAAARLQVHGPGEEQPGQPLRPGRRRQHALPLDEQRRHHREVPGRHPRLQRGHPHDHGAVHRPPGADADARVLPRRLLRRPAD
mmetsp:Transcript_87440/g.225239  ORF Transcript_87440/g.225239 Transcript_87440/m.225239 type:complete len:289 (+) Transcript_87440:1485-2351(+)